MRRPAWLLLSCAIACQGFSAQSDTGDAGDDYSVPTARVTLTPRLAGDLFLSIYTNVPGLSPDALRREAFPCNWRSQIQREKYIAGSCRQYLASDGSSAHVNIVLAALAGALHRAGAHIVNLSLWDDGNPLAQPPIGWTSIPAPRTYGARSRQATAYYFVSKSDSELPTPFEIRIGTPWQPSRLVIPLVVTLFCPALLALWLRRRAERQGAAESSVVWANWILTAMWLYWISSVSTSSVAGLAARLSFASDWLALLLGAAVLAFPPLIAIGASIAILARAPAGAPEPVAVAPLVKAAVARQAALIVPLAIVMVGASMLYRSRQVAFISFPLAYFAYRMLRMRVGRWMLGPAVALNHGELAQSASAIARRAGVTLGAVYLFGNRVAQQANAFASGSKVIAMTRGLVERLTRRELNAVIGHEVGHLRGKHVGARLAAFCAYILVIVPLAVTLSHRAHLPDIWLSLPMLPLAYIMSAAYLSRRHEFSADARAAELTCDPEGLIAALARLRQITRSPVDWGGIQGSILSHPSMRERVLAIAKRDGLSAERALALLNDPDLLAADVPPELRHYPLPAECAGPDILFTSSAKQEFSLWSRWIRNVLLVALTVCASLLIPTRNPLALGLFVPAGIAIVGWLYALLDNWLDRAYLTCLSRRLRRRAGPMAEGGIFAGVLPGHRVVPTEGFYLWDAGFLWLTPDHLTYRGERTSFSLPRESVRGIAVAKGPRIWFRSYTVMLQADDGSFSLSRPDRGHTQREARRLERRLTAWLRGEPTAYTPAGNLAPRPDPAMLASQPANPSGWLWARAALLRAFMLWLGFAIVAPLTWAETHPALALAQFVCPLGYVFALCPLFFQSHSRTKKQPEQTTASVAA